MIIAAVSGNFSINGISVDKLITGMFIIVDTTNRRWRVNASLITNIKPQYCPHIELIVCVSLEVEVFISPLPIVVFLFRQRFSHWKEICIHTYTLFLFLSPSLSLSFFFLPSLSLSLSPPLRTYPSIYQSTIYSIRHVLYPDVLVTINCYFQLIVSMFIINLVTYVKWTYNGW